MKLKTVRPLDAQRQWYRIENKVNEDTYTAEIYIYDEIGYWGVSANEFIQDLRALSASHLNVHINSPGGEVYDGYAIYNAIRNYPATVTVHIDGLAASAASFIAMSGNKVVIAPFAEVMIHEAYTMCVGSADDMRRKADELDRVCDNIASIYTSKAGGDKEAWRELMRAETWYSADEAVAAGLADEIAAEPGSDDGSAARSREWDLTAAYNYAGRCQAPPPGTSAQSYRVNNTRAKDIRTPRLQPTAPVAVEDEFAFDPAIFKAVVGNVYESAPAPTERPTPPSTEVPFAINPAMVREAIERALA